MKKLELGLRIKPINGEVFDVWGPVTWKYVDGAKYWYCAGSSYPAEIVEKVLEISMTAKEVYEYAVSISKAV